MHDQSEKIDRGIIAAMAIIFLIMVAIENSLLARVGTIPCMIGSLLEMLAILKLELNKYRESRSSL